MAIYHVKINGISYTLKNAETFYRRAGRAIRRWHKYVRGLVAGKLITICLHTAQAADILRNVSESTRAVFDAIDEAMFRQRVLIDATIGG